MNESLLAALLGLLVAGLGGLLVPALIASVPEPAPKESEPDEPDEPAEPPKMLYADIAARPGLRWRSALVSAVSGCLVGAATGLGWPLLWLLPLTPVAVGLWYRTLPLPTA